MPEESTPALKKIDVTIARLRLLLADVKAREAALTTQRRTFQDQREKLITFCMYGDGSLDQVLPMMADVEERITHAEATLRSLEAVRGRTERELESLQITKGIEEARSILLQLQAKQQSLEPGGASDALTGAELQAEIARLQSLINEASERAARSIEETARRR